MDPQTSPPPKFPSTRAVSFQLLVGLAAAVLCGVLIWFFWRELGLPDAPGYGAMAKEARPRGLALFCAWALPAAIYAPSLALGLLIFLLPRAWGRAAEVAATALRLDVISYLALPGLSLLPIFWRQLGAGFTALGICFLGVAALKVCLLLWVLWEGFLTGQAREEAGRAARRKVAVFLVALTAFGLSAAWINQSISTAGDEVSYLITAHALAHHGTSDPAQVVADQSYQDFYWARWSPALAQPAELARAWAFQFLLTPVYWLGGRLGVLLFFAGLMALLATQLLAWLEGLGVRAGPAAGAAGLVLTSAPVFLISQEVYPAVPVMLLFIWGLRLLKAQAQRPHWAGLGILAIALVICLLKLRMFPIAGGLLLMAGFQTLAHHWGWRRALFWGCVILAALVAAISLTPSSWLPSAVARPWQLAYEQYIGNTSHFWQPMVIFFQGVALDQNFGVLFVAPVFLIALAGIPAALRKMPLAACQALVPVVLYLGIICYVRWFQWYGGFAIPGRFVAVLLPALALFLALSLQALGRSWWRLVVLVPAVWGLAYSWLVTLIPQLRFSRPDGANPLVRAVQDALHIEFHHLLPSTFSLSPALPVYTALAALAFAALAWLVWHRAGGARPDAGPPPAGLTDIKALPVVLGVLVFALVWAGQKFPPDFWEAEQMQAQGAIRWTEYAYPPPFKRGMVLQDGQHLSTRVYAPGGETKLLVVGTPPKAGGNLEISLDGQSKNMPWKRGEGPMVFELGSIPQGHHELKLAWRACPERRCGLLVDRVELEP